MDDCKMLDAKFYEKFKVFPFITFEDLSDYGKNFCIWKTTTICTEYQYSYYMMGRSLYEATQYIDRLIVVPSAIVTFDTSRDKTVYGLQIEMNKLSEKKITETDAL